MVQVPVLAQVKINFTPEVRRSDEKPTGLADFDYSSERNKEDVSVPKKTRGVERYDKLNACHVTYNHAYIICIK